MKKEYYSPEMTVEVFLVQNIVCTSGDTWYTPDTELDPDNNQPGEDGW